MKASRAQIEKALKAGGSQHRFLLLHGPDESGSRGLLKLIAEAMGPNAERIDLSGSDLRGDPARLADEAASISLFGGARYIVVAGAGEESSAAVEALIEAPQTGNPVILVAGGLRPTSRLLKLALAEPAALTFASYVPEGGDADRLVLDLGRQRGLPMRPDVARRIADAAGANRAVIENELDKFALYLDASPERPKTLEQDVVDLLGAAGEGGDLSRLVDSVVGGNAQQLDAELLRLSGEGVEGVGLVRAVMRRLLLLARLRAEVERGNSVTAVMTSHGKSLFWKDKDAIEPQLARWRSDLLARAASRLLASQLRAMAPGGQGPLAVEDELLAICRQAARLR